METQISPLSPQQFVELIAGSAPPVKGQFGGTTQGIALLARHKAALAPTRWPDVYIIKFDETTESTDPEVIRLRGLIFNLKTKQILSLGHPVPYEFRNLSPEDQSKVTTNLRQTTYRVEEALDGTLLRLWNHPEHGWMLSTNSKEDANEAFWMHGISFAQQFREAFPRIQTDRLNPDYVYIFRVCHPYNVIVVNHSIPRIYHVATYNRTTCLEVPIEDIDGVDGSDLGIALPFEWEGPVSVSEILAATTRSKSLPVRSAGWMVIVSPDREGVVYRYRFENQNYTLARSLRGDSNDLTYTLLANYHQGQLEPFLQYYPIYQMAWQNLYAWIWQLANDLYEEYVQVFIKKSRALSAHSRGFLNALQGKYLETSQRPRPRMTREHVHQFLLEQDPQRIYHLLKEVCF